MPPIATTFPPTPAPSTDIKGREGNALTPVETAFTLPPSAVGGSHQDSHGNPNAPFTSPLSPTASRKASNNSSDVSLPPPPSRSRKIIQVKPKGSSEERDATYNPSIKGVKGSASKDTGKRKSTAKGGGAAAAGTAAGRKVARKTAHSIIERRRRSKMNEEFGVLKDLIPACRGCEMHKLAILQASIEYLRYLENCVAELKAGRATSSEAPSLPSRSSHPSDEHDEQDDDNDGRSDVEMDIDDSHSTAHSHSHSTHHSHHQPYTTAAPSTSSTAISATSPQYNPIHRSSTSSTTPSTLPSPYFGPVNPLATFSTTTSPIFGPYYNRHRHSLSHGSTSLQHVASTTTSPIIYPQHQGLNEAEASTALLMLNQDRRGKVTQSAGASERRGMSVKDMLSS